jgi:anti-anti-sigma factor
VPTISASHAPATVREGARTASLASIARSSLRCVARDFGIGVIHLVLTGKLDLATALQAERALRATQADAQVVILDLRQLQFIGCTAARVALMADARARRIGRRLVVLAGRAPTPRLFALARLHRRLEIVEQPHAQPSRRCRHDRQPRPVFAHRHPAAEAGRAPACRDAWARRLRRPPQPPRPPARARTCELDRPFAGRGHHPPPLGVAVRCASTIRGEQRLAGSRGGPALRAAVRARNESGLPVQAPGSGRRSRH